MKVHEYQAKEIFSQYGIPVERHVLCNTPDEAVKAFRQLEVDKVVVKATSVDRWTRKGRRRKTG